MASRKVDNASGNRVAIAKRFLGIQEHDDGKETGRQDAIPRLVHLHPSVRCAALARLSRVDDLPLACSTGH